MSKKKNGKRKQQKQSKWTPPKGASAYFYASSDEEFKRRHPIGYFFLVLLGISALLLPAVLYTIYTISEGYNSGWIMFGWVGAFIIGIGLFNFVAIIIKQYLGHLVSILSFVIGGIMVAVSIVMLQ